MNIQSGGICAIFAKELQPQQRVFLTAGVALTAAVILTIVGTTLLALNFSEITRYVGLGSVCFVGVIALSTVFIKGCLSRCAPKFNQPQIEKEGIEVADKRSLDQPSPQNEEKEENNRSGKRNGTKSSAANYPVHQLEYMLRPWVSEIKGVAFDKDLRAYHPLGQAILIHPKEGKMVQRPGHSPKKLAKGDLLYQERTSGEIDFVFCDNNDCRYFRLPAEHKNQSEKVISEILRYLESNVPSA